jgi:tRNA(Ile)-lysidine synthase
VRSLEAVVRQALDQRLLKDDARPIAIGLSGGGDSVALTLMAHDWARETGRPLLLLTVDHGLQPDAARWTATCAALADDLGRPFRALVWTGDKPRTGLPAAARAARHRLLAEAAREAGASVLLLGHTADDRLEAAIMRRAGSTTPDPREWAPSPAWPEGRRVFLLRPMLEVRRAELRDWLTARRQRWIDDPANLDLRYARPRARQETAAAPPPPAAAEAPLALAAGVTHQAGMITISRQALRDADVRDLQRFVAIACVCVGGGARRPASRRIGRLAGMLQGQGSFIATLAGARIETDPTRVRIFREAGDISRHGSPAVQIAKGQSMVWDGRFEIAPQDVGVVLTRLSGLSRRLPRDQQITLLDLPPAVRRGLPAMTSDDGLVTCPALDGRASSLIPERLIAAAGLVEREPDQAPLPST